MPDSNAPASGFQFGLANLKPAEPSEKSPSPFPTAPGANSPRTPPGSTSPRAFRPRSQSARWRWCWTVSSTDLDDPSNDAKIEFIAREDPRALELIRHDCAHVLAEAVQSCGRAHRSRSGL